MNTIKSNSFNSFAHSTNIVHNVKPYTQHGETQRWKQIKHVEDRLQK